ncbi:MAG TPA: TlpA disulfide reductase family protein [Bryobacteraceae bacterium]|nr:TlpA disulfide reductase family protein [Bryobacteraceae bacterium]
MTIRLLALLVGAWVLAAPAQAPALQPVDENSYAKLVASHKGSVLLVNFWATWCAPCREEMPQLARLAREYRGKSFRLVTVSCDEPEDRSKAAAFLAQHGAPQPAYLKQVDEDETFINSVDKKWSGALPALFLYDRAGRLTRSFIGETEIPALEKAVRALL